MDYVKMGFFPNEVCMHICQDSTGPSEGLATTGADAEKTSRLPACTHHQERHTEVINFNLYMHHGADLNLQCVLNFFTLSQSKSWESLAVCSILYLKKHHHSSGNY